MTPDEEAALADLVFALTAPHTQEEIAQHLGIPRERVSDIEKRALLKMRKLIQKQALKAKAGPKLTDMW